MVRELNVWVPEGDVLTLNEGDMVRLRHFEIVENDPIDLKDRQVADVDETGQIKIGGSEGNGHVYVGERKMYGALLSDVRVRERQATVYSKMVCHTNTDPKGNGYRSVQTLTVEKVG